MKNHNTVEAAHFREKSSRWTFLVPLIFAIFVWLLPNPSVNWLITSALLMLVSIAWHIVFRLKKAYRFRRSMTINGYFQVTLVALFCMLIGWRLTTTKPWLLAVYLLVFALVSWASYILRRVIMQEFYSPKTKTGKTLIVLGALGGGAAGALGFSVGREVNQRAGGAIFIALALFLTVLTHSHLLKREEPDWEPTR